MAVRRPLVIVNGRKQELPTGDTLDEPHQARTDNPHDVTAEQAGALANSQGVRLTVSATAPDNPSVNDIWIDIS